MGKMMANIFNNENSYINIRDKWLIGKWDELRSLEIEDIQEYTERIEIAILIASAWQQTNNTDKVYFFVNIAIKWGCSKYTASQFLIAGLFNALGCLKATQTKRQNLISTFQLAIDIDDFSHTDSSVLAELRMREELKKLNILSSSINNSLLDKEFNIKEPVVSGISNITKKNAEKRNNLQLLILGMHRSGTSCITNLLKNMGAYFGTSNKSTGSNLENPKGFWERRDVRQITDTLLFSINTDWHKISGYYPEKVPSSIRCKALKDLDSILADLNQYKTWILKEPRLTILLPLIQCKFERPIAVCVYRNPLEVALSLQKRNGFPLNFGLALWEFYTISMINNTSDMDRIFVSYNALIDDPINGSSQICNALNNFGLSLKLPNESDLLYLVDSNLYRNKIHSYDLEEILTIGQLNLYEKIKKEKNLFKTSISTTLRDNLSFYENIQHNY